MGDEGGVDRMAEKPEDSRKVAGGTCGGTGRERQASAAGEEKTRPRARELMEEVCVGRTCSRLCGGFVRIMGRRAWTG